MMKTKMIIGFLKRLLKIIIKKDFIACPQIIINKIKLGDKFASWTFHRDIINQKSIIYSFGVGDNISFDLEIGKKYNCNVYLFDPTPRSNEWIAKQKLPKNLHFYPFGLANYDGKAKFNPPKNPNHVSFSLIIPDLNEKTINLDVKKISTIMNELNHNKIDILKMDIEGAEYDVIEDIINSKIEIAQILVEFHHRFPTIGIQKSIMAIMQLKAAGYKIFHVSNNGEEFSFILDKK